MSKLFKDLFNTAMAAGKTYLKEWGLIVSFFILTVTISNLTFKIFGFRLIPVIKTVFDAFHEFCHLIMRLLVFSWFTYCLESIWYGLTWLCSLLLPIIPWRPHITIPGLVTDIALVSLAFTRVFQTSDLIIPRPVREEAENNMIPDLWEEIELVEGPFWGPVHRFLHRTNAGIWKLIDTVQRVLIYPFRASPKYSIFVRRLLITIAAAVLMWGYIRFAGYVINVCKARHLTAPIMTVRKRFFKYFSFNLLGAIGATVIFFLFNGWVAEYLEP